MAGIHVERVDEYRWLIPKTSQPGMRVDALIFASHRLLDAIRQDQSLQQTVNVTMLPGIVGKALAMPDIHQGYGFPIGGVAAMDLEDGVVSPGGVGFDINCGVRLLGTSLHLDDVRPKLKDLVHQLFRDIPSGTGQAGHLTISEADLDDILVRGPRWAVERGMGSQADLDQTEESGRIGGADAAAVSHRARARGKPQLGTLGSGNHFVEVQTVDEIFDEEVAHRYRLEKGSVTVLIHTGSRGLGHQVCTDYVSEMDSVM